MEQNVVLREYYDHLMMDGTFSYVGQKDLLFFLLDSNLRKLPAKPVLCANVLESLLTFHPEKIIPDMSFVDTSGNIYLRCQYLNEDLLTRDGYYCKSRLLTIPEGFTFESSEIEIRLDELQAFLKVTGDAEVFHSSDQQSQESYYGKTVCSGFLTLAHLVRSTWEMWGKHPEIFLGSEIIQLGIDAKFNKPIFIGDALRHHWKLVSQSQHRRGLKVVWEIHVKRDDEVMAVVHRDLLYVFKTASYI